MNNSALNAAKMLKENLNEIENAISSDNGDVVIQTLKRMATTMKMLKKITKDDIKLKKNIEKNRNNSGAGSITPTEVETSNNSTASEECPTLPNE